MKKEGSTGFITRVCRECFTPKAQSPQMIMRQAKLFLRCMLRFQALRSWHEANTAASPDLLRRHPMAPVFVDRPYLSTKWTLVQRLSVIRDHYGIAERFPLFTFPHDGALPLAAMPEVQQDLQFRLEKPLWFVNEGEAALSLFAGETRLYSLIFTLGNLDGASVAYVGGLQGLNSDTARDTYRTLTHAAHGMRPRDLLFSGFRFLCQALGVVQILAVSDEYNARRSPYFAGNEMVHFSLDEAWGEYGGVLDAQGFYAINPAILYRAVEDIPSRKRAQYRRRYEMLDEVAARIRSTAASSTV